MELKLIQAGGFIGKMKAAYTEIDNPSEQLKQAIANMEQSPPAKKTAIRDKEQYFLEIDGATPQAVTPETLDGELRVIVEELLARLKY